jgi:uncharacterized protein (DUF2147 family)
MRMSRLFVAAVALAAAAVPASAASPEGAWQTAKGDARYQVFACDGDNLCARLVWLREDARNPKNLQYLNKTVVKAAPVAENKWRGTVNIDGQRATGSITMVDADSIRVEGCKAVFCKTLSFERV